MNFVLKTIVKLVFCVLEPQPINALLLTNVRLRSVKFSGVINEGIIMIL